MKKILLSAALLSSIISFSQTTTNYIGNGKSSFGGAVGLGTLDITETPDSVSFKLTRGSGIFDSLIVFYIDIPDLTGGIASTSVLSGSSTDQFVAAVAGKNPSMGSAILNFPADFHPDGAVVFNKDSGRIYAFASIPFLGTLVVPRDSFLVSSSATTYIAGSSKEKLGLSGSLNFKFVGTYIGRSASRSNEAFGDPFDNYSRPAGTSSYNPYTITSYLTFTSAALPVRLVDFKAAKEDNSVNVFWSVAEEAGIDKYELQRSTDGILFYPIASFKAKNSSTSSSYNFKDLSALGGTNYYRLVITERARAEFSKVIALNIAGGKNKFIASCNAKVLDVTLNGINAGAYKLLILNNNGQVVQAEDIKADAPYKRMQVQLNPNLKGIYRVALQSAGARYTANIFVE